MHGYGNNLRHPWAFTIIHALTIYLPSHATIKDVSEATVQTFTLKEVYDIPYSYSATTSH